MTALRGLTQLGLVQLPAFENLGQAQAAARAASSARAFDSAARAASFAPHFLDLPPSLIGDQAKNVAGGTSSPAQGAGGSESAVSRAKGGDWLTLSSPARDHSPAFTGLTAPEKPSGGGAALPPRGGSGGPSLASPSTRGAITPLRFAAPGGGSGSSSAANASSAAALLAALASASTTPGSAAPGTAAVPAALGPKTPGSAAVPAAGSPGTAGQSLGAMPLSSSGGFQSPSSTPIKILGNASGPTQGQFPYFPLYVLDNNDGVVLFPGATQFGVAGGYVDLQAQVSGATVSSYNWNTTNLDAINIAGANTYQLTFQWSTSIPSPVSSSVTLSVTDSNNQIETYTYDFFLTQGAGSSGSGGGSGGGSTSSGNATWPSSLTPSSALDSAPAFGSDGVSVGALSGALNAVIPLPSYNPNVAPLALTYNSLTADPRPIIVVEHPIDPTQSVPTQVSAQLTLNGSGGSTWSYGTSLLNGGDIQQIALQANANSLATGRYAYSATVVDERSTNTTTVYSGSVDVLNQSSSAFGDGWTLQGLEQITSASGGVILNVGDAGKSLWFTTGTSGSGGTTYTDPAGEFSTLFQNSNGTYTRTLTDGTQIDYSSSGYESAVVDLNGLHTTFAYNGSNQLTSIEDPYGGFTTFTYSGGHLQTIQDPAGRLTTFTFSGGSLQAVEQADGSRTSYTYDSAGRMTTVKDPLSNVVTVAYDSAERVATITRPDGTTELFTNDQESGWTNTGTPSSPAAATLLAQATSTYTDPNGNTTALRPDWMGLGQVGVAVDAAGNVAMFDLNSNGLATVAIDRLNRITQFSYDSVGNPVTITYADFYTDQYTYNSYSEPLTHIDANGNTTTYTYDSHGNLTGITDPLGDQTTLTYTPLGQVQSVTDPNNHTTTFQYDSQSRLTTVVNADGTTTEYGYDSQGDVVKFTNELGYATTYSYDALDRQTGTTDALGDVATYTYNSGGNLIEDQQPTPASQTPRTTFYAYDSLHRVTTITDPMGYQTVLGYDAAGNLISTKDPMGRITTMVYNDLNQAIVTVDPMGNRTTTTYDANGEATQVVDPMDRITTIAYNNMGQVATVTDPLGNTTTYSYTPTGQTASEATPLPYEGMGSGSGGSTLASYSYDKADRLVAYTDPNGNTTSYVYDSGGNLIAVEDANQNTTTYAYDSRNQVTTITDALGHTTVLGYNAAGDQTTVTDALGHTTTTLYDALNRPTTMINALGGTTVIAYDAAGRETSLTDPVGNTTRWSYNADDQVTTLTQPNGGTVTYVYDADGELTDTTDAIFRRTTYSYNADGEQTGETWVNASPAEAVAYTYNADGELTGARDSFATLTFTYDSGGNQLTQSTSGPGTNQPNQTLTSTFDPLHDRITLTDNLSTQAVTTFTYDNGQRITEVATAFSGTMGPQVDYTYDPGNRITAESRTIAGVGTAVNTSFSYDAANRQTTITDTAVSGGTSTPIATYVYSYDNANRVTTQVNNDGTYTYTYDNTNQLTGASQNGTPVEAYAYDANGNRTGTGFATTVMNEQTASPGETYTYDRAGNLTAETNTSTHVTTSYTYDFRNRLTEVTVAGTVVATYTYDALNRRIGIDDKGAQTWTVYDGTSPYADFSGGSGALLDRYMFGPGVVDGAVVDELLARTDATGNTSWYLMDKLGSVRDIVAAASGAVIDHVVYDSFGNVLSETSPSNGDRFKFAGMEWDGTVGQYYDRARYYDAAIGRFMSLDSLGFAAGSYDLFSYVANGPTNAVDTNGHAPNSNSPLQDQSAKIQQLLNQLKNTYLREMALQVSITLAANALKWAMQQSWSNAEAWRVGMISMAYVLWAERQLTAERLAMQGLAKQLVQTEAEQLQYQLGKGLRGLFGSGGGN